MMKRMMTFLCTALTVTALMTGCGSSGKTEAKSLDLPALWEEIYALESDWGEGYFGDLTEDEELLESYYPGLKDIPAKQLIVRAPMMSSVVSEFVLMECETEADADKAEDILEKRAADQAAGGAWYPESMAAWEEAEVIQEGPYVALVACAGHQAEAEELVKANFGE